MRFNAVMSGDEDDQHGSDEVRQDGMLDEPPDFGWPSAETLNSILKAGEWPDAGTETGKMYRRFWLPRIQALKLVPAYRARWGGLAEQHGRDAVLLGLQHYRERLLLWSGARVEKAGAELGHTAIPPGLLESLWDLTVVVRGSEIHAVDPTNPADNGLPPLPINGSVDPWACLGWEAAWPITELKYGRWWPPGPNWPYMPVMVDLRHPDKLIHADLRRLRKVYGVHPTLRVKAQLSWEDLRPAFAVLHDRERDDCPPVVDLWQRYSGKSLRGAHRKANQRQMYRVLRRARELVEEMRVEVESPTTYSVPAPPGLLHEVRM